MGAEEGVTLTSRYPDAGIRVEPRGMKSLVVSEGKFEKVMLHNICGVVPNQKEEVDGCS